VALYPGAQTLGDFPADHTPAEGTAVREVPEHRSQRALQNIIGTATVQGDNSGQNVGVNYGTMSQNTQTINNQAANQGAQGTFQGPVSFDHSRSTFDQRGQEVKGNQYNANRDLTHIGGDKVGGDKVGGDKVGGDKIDAQGAQGFVNRPSGPVSQQFGDKVGGDKNTGDISVGNVSGSGIAIGHKAQAQSQQSGDADAVARAFSQVYQAINARPPDPDVDQDEMTETVQNIQAEAQKGEQASEKKLSRWLNYLGSMADDIFDVTVAALTGPQAAAATVARKVAERAKQARGQG
jgi:translation elongation factor EF-1beta